MSLVLTQLYPGCDPTSLHITALIYHGACLISLDVKSALSSTKRRTLQTLLINPIDGIQRILLDTGLPSYTSSIDTILCTQSIPPILSGIAGLYYAMSDTGGVGLVNVRGPSGTATLVKAYEPFVKRKFPSLHVKDVDSISLQQAKFEKIGCMEILTISVTCLAGNNSSTNGSSTGSNHVKKFCYWCYIDQVNQSESSSSSEEEDVDDVEYDQQQSNNNILPPNTNSNHPLPSSSSSIVCYSIRFASQTIISFIDCAEGMENNLLQSPHLRFICTHHIPTLTVHLSVESCINSIPYKQFLEECFISSTRHIFTHTLSLQYRLIKSNEFIQQQQQQQQNSNDDIHFMLHNNLSIPSRKLLKLFPTFEEIESIMATQQDDITNNNNTSSTHHDPLTKRLKNSFPHQQSSTGITSTPCLISLGTGASKPSTLRGLSCLQIWYNESTSILFDVGDDTINQMRRAYGEDFLMKTCLSSIQYVWISHHHLDHHNGLATLLYQRKKLFPNIQPLFVFGPYSIEKFLKATLLDCYIFHHCSQASIILPHLIHNTVTVQHCYDAYAISIYIPPKTTTNGSNKIIIYSGDTRPLPELFSSTFTSNNHEIIALIHEATFGNGYEQDAMNKKHSTIQDAVSVCKAIQAKKLILTHFSQRYAEDIPQDDLLQAQDELQQIEVIPLHDLMFVKLLL
jgi:ribonuclease BN (tRNA processing enzyme)